MIKNPKKILICQQHQIGDVLLATPCVRILHERFPDAEIHFLTEKKCASVLENNPLLDKIWVIDKDAEISGMIALYAGIYREHFDIVVDFQQLIRLKLAVLASRAPVRLSYKPKWYNKPFYNLYHPEDQGYASKAKAGVMRPLGVEWDGQAPELHLTPQEREWARAFFAAQGVQEDEFLLTVDSTHRRITRKWPAEYYSGLLKILSERHPEIKVLMLYGPGEKAYVEGIVREAGNPSFCIIPEKQTSLRQMGALIERANGHFGNCSSPRHFAVAVGTPSLAVLGGNSPGGWTFPSDQHAYYRNEHSENRCIGCNRSECKNGTLDCLYALDPESVYQQMKSFFFRKMD